jgi:hypothetical protein
VMQRGAAFLHVFERDVVLPKYLMCFLVRHSSPVLKTALEHGQTPLPRDVFRLVL